MNSIHKKNELESVVIRVVGDSGDGIQIAGTSFSTESAIAGNSVETLPCFPAEIRAPAGSLAGVSGFQIHFAQKEIYTAGDKLDALVALNVAALKQNIGDLLPGGLLLLNEDGFGEKAWSKLGYCTNPLDDTSLLKNYKTIIIPITRLTREALTNTELSPKEMARCKNFFTLGILYWLYGRPYDETINWIRAHYANSALASANITALKAGISFAEATELFDVYYEIKKANLPHGTYTNINGSTAITYGLIAASEKSGLPLFLGAYPITPASEIFHEISKHCSRTITAFQAEDEISAITAAVGASFAGNLGVTSTSGPGMSLKTEALGLAVMAELPLVVINSMRGGPSTGLPTKAEQADLLQALFGRHGEAPVCVLAASSAFNAFDMTYEACRLAVKYMSPVILLTDGYINNSSQPWHIADPANLNPIDPGIMPANSKDYAPYRRNKDTLARQWAIPGTQSLMHRVGGLEKENISGNISYDPNNHELMTKLRAEKIARIEQEIPPLKVEGPEHGPLLVLGWGSTDGTIKEATRFCVKKGLPIARTHLHYLNPLPPNLGQILNQYDKILIPEINTGQLRHVLKAKYLVDSIGLNIVRGQPLKVSDLVDKIETILG